MEDPLKEVTQIEADMYDLLRNRLVTVCYDCTNTMRYADIPFHRQQEICLNILLKFLVEILLDFTDYSPEEAGELFTQAMRYLKDRRQHV